MSKSRFATVALLLTALALPAAAQSQGNYDPAAVITAQKAALAKLSFMDGAWKGSAWTILPSGEKHVLTQTERVGPFLDGAVKVVEGRGYEADGKLAFNAFGTISYDPAKSAYTMHSYAMGYVGDYVLTPTADGFVWEISAGPMTIRYTATIKGGKWVEVGDRLVPGQEPVRFLEMNLERAGDTGWPAEGAVGP
ncbi:MAG: DUF1579 domain-containing protein [Candidatus Latescibacteria bacterium]|nr:DUF1579 domain-containing protein [Candidatus Latescibacterota bacterium]